MYNKSMGLLSKFIKKEKQKENNAFSAIDITKYKINEYIVYSEEKGIYKHGFDLQKILEEFKKDFPDIEPKIIKVPPKRFISW